jgi:hypothetical protein
MLHPDDRAELGSGPRDLPDFARCQHDRAQRHVAAFVRERRPPSRATPTALRALANQRPRRCADRLQLGRAGKAGDLVLTDRGAAPWAVDAPAVGGRSRRDELGCIACRCLTTEVCEHRGVDAGDERFPAVDDTGAPGSGRPALTKEIRS